MKCAELVELERHKAHADRCLGFPDVSSEAGELMDRFAILSVSPATAVLMGVVPQGKTPPEMETGECRGVSDLLHGALVPFLEDIAAWAYLVAWSSRAWKTARLKPTH